MGFIGGFVFGVLLMFAAISLDLFEDGKAQWPGGHLYYIKEAGDGR